MRPAWRAAAAWIVLVGVVLVEAAIARLLWRAGLPRGPWLGLVALPVAYAALLVVSVRGLGALGHRAARIGILAGLHVAVSVLGALLHAVAAPPLIAALLPGGLALPALPLIQLALVPVALVPFRDRLAPARAGGRPGPARSWGTTPTPVRGAPTPTVLRRPVATPTARVSRPPASSGDRATTTRVPPAPASPPTRPIAPPGAPTPSPPSSPRPPVTTRVTTAAAGGPRGESVAAASPTVPGAPSGPEPAATTTPSPALPPSGAPVGPRPGPGLARSAAPPTPVSPKPPPRDLSQPATTAAPAPATPTPASAVGLPAASGPTGAAVPAVRPAPRPAPPVPGAGAEPPHVGATEVAAIRAAFTGLGPLEVDVERRMGLTLVVAASPRLPREQLARAALRFTPLLGARLGGRAVRQATLRGSAGALVLTPLGPPRAGGPVLVVAIRDRAALALVELRARGVAQRVGMPASWPSGGDVAEASPEAILGVTGVPPAVSALTGQLAAWGPVTVRALRDPDGPLLLYLCLAGGVDAHEAGPLALALHRATDMNGEPGGIGTVESVILHFVGERVVALRPVPGTADGATLLVAAGETLARPGLAYGELERAATRLGAA